jgi:hypothetical protein
LLHSEQCLEAWKITGIAKRTESKKARDKSKNFTQEMPLLQNRYIDND